jgi:hypothetical protein
MIAATAERLIASADELTTLDQAIGDGDHGVNMKQRAARRRPSRCARLHYKPLKMIASFLGESSLRHLDPGRAKIIIDALSSFLEVRS